MFSKHTFQEGVAKREILPPVDCLPSYENILFCFLLLELGVGGLMLQPHSDKMIFVPYVLWEACNLTAVDGGNELRWI